MILARRIVGGLLAATLVAVAPLASPAQAAPAAVPHFSVPPPATSTLSSCPAKGYHYASATTATTASGSNGCGYASTPYTGWIGIDGQISTPTAAPAGGFNGNADHAVGWIGMTGYSGGTANAWIQIGWYTGAVGNCPIITNGTYALYLEYRTLSGSYQCTRLSPLGYGGLVTYRIQYASGCWYAYYNYDTNAGAVCDLPGSMAAQATNELYNSSGNAIVMPLSNFGSSNPNTNQALRLRNGTGSYEPWDGSLTARYTATSDERTGGAPHTYYSPYAAYYHILMYGN